MTANCVVTNWRITYWGGSMDGGRIDVSTDHGESYTCAERERERERERLSAVVLPLFRVRLLIITSTNCPSLMFRTKTLSHCRLTLVTVGH